MGQTIFTDANLLDGEHPAQPGSSVVVEGDRIVSVTTGTVDYGPDDRVVRCDGRSIMPGMVQGHFHSTYLRVGVELMPPLGFAYPPAYQAYVASRNAWIVLERGFTSVVGANEAFDVDPSLAAAISDGLVAGPRVIAGSRDLITTADSNDTTPWWWEAGVSSGVRICDGPDEFRRGVRQEIKRGAEIVKLYATGGHGVRLGADIASLTRDELRAAADAADGLGKRVRAHVASKPAIMACLEAGVDILDHGDGLDQECIEAMAEAGTILVPSLPIPALILEAGAAAEPADGVPTDDDMHTDEFRAICEILPAAVEAGIRICLGDDYGTVILPHDQCGKELAVCVKYASISPLEAIRWATVNGGALVGREDLGRIVPGAAADLVVVEGDPLQDIALLGDVTNIRAVMRDGLLLVDKLDHASSLPEPAGDLVG